MTEEKGTSTGQPPIKELRAGAVKISLWESKFERDDRTVIRHSAKIEKRYYDKESGQWKTSSTYFADDLLRLRLLADKATEFMLLKEKGGEDRAAS